MGQVISRVLVRSHWFFLLLISFAFLYTELAPRQLQGAETALRGSHGAYCQKCVPQDCPLSCSSTLAVCRWVDNNTGHTKCNHSNQTATCSGNPFDGCGDEQKVCTGCN